jgi:hypothetical protein
MVSNLRFYVIMAIALAMVTLSCGFVRPIIERVRSGEAAAGLEEETPTPLPVPTLRPTFTQTPTDTPVPTKTPTPIPTETETLTPAPTETETPAPTNTPRPYQPPPPTDTPPPPPPTNTPLPNWRFKVREQGDNMSQRTQNNLIAGVVKISDGNGTPLGGLYVMGQHSSGKTYKSPESSWSDSEYIGFQNYAKIGNVKVELGGFEDGTWQLYVADSGGNQLSDKLSLSFSSDPSQWHWVFIWWAE